MAKLKLQAQGEHKVLVVRHRKCRVACQEQALAQVAGASYTANTPHPPYIPPPHPLPAIMLQEQPLMSVIL